MREGERIAVYIMTDCPKFFATKQYMEIDAGQRASSDLRISTGILAHCVILKLRRSITIIKVCAVEVSLRRCNQPNFLNIFIATYLSRTKSPFEEIVSIETRPNEVHGASTLGSHAYSHNNIRSVSPIDLFCHELLIRD